MNLFNILNEDLIFELHEIPKGKKNVILFDMDDTLLTANNIHIIKIDPNGKETALTPDQYAKEPKIEEKARGVKYDYREFRDPSIVEKSIATGTPIWKNLRILDDHVKNKWAVGILTARGLEDIVYRALQKWLMFRDDKTGELKPIGKKLARNIVHAVNDNVKQYTGMTDFEKKANVIREYAKTYDLVKFVDDDPANIEAVKEMVKKEKLNNVVVIQAWKEK
jgi:hypothetical protein